MIIWLPRPRIVLSNEESESEDFFIVTPIFLFSFFPSSFSLLADSLTAATYREVALGVRPLDVWVRKAGCLDCFFLFRCFLEFSPSSSSSSSSSLLVTSRRSRLGFSLGFCLNVGVSVLFIFCCFNSSWCWSNCWISRWSNNK